MKSKIMFFNRIYYLKHPEQIDEMTVEEIKLLLSTCGKSVSLIEICSLTVSISSIFIASQTAISSDRINIILNSISVTASEKKLQINGFLGQMKKMADEAQNNFNNILGWSIFISIFIGALFLIYSLTNNCLKFNLNKALINKDKNN